MISARVVKALDQIRTQCDEHAKPKFKEVIGYRSNRQPARLPSSQEVMRRIGNAIAYSQGARSSLIDDLIDSGKLDDAFCGFDHRQLSKTSKRTIQKEHWHELGCMRFRSKIGSILKSARVLVNIDKDCGSFGSYMMHYAIPRRIRSGADIDVFWNRFDKLRGDLQKRGMPFFNQTTSLLQLLLELDYDVIKPDLIIMRLARRIGWVKEETGDVNLRDSVWSIQAYCVLRCVRAAAMDWYLLSFGGQTGAGGSLRRKFCPTSGGCRNDACRLGNNGLCMDFRRD